MLKSILLASSVMIAVPAFAQDVPAPATTAPTEQVTPTAPEATPATPSDAAIPPQDQPVPATPPAPDTAPATTAEAPAQPAPAEPAAQPAADANAALSNSQVEAIIAKEFPIYDADKSGELSATEFDGWMTKLRVAAEPGFNAGSPEGRAWLTASFAKADKDQSKGLNQAEMVGYMKPAAG